MADMKLYALVDFPDDSLVEYTPDMVDSLVGQLAGYGISRLYFQYYGNADYGWCMNCDAPEREESRKTARNMPNYSRVFVVAAHRRGMEACAVMRPQEQGEWTVYSPYYTRGIRSGLPHLGGKILIHSEFLRRHPDLRIKRRSWDLDPDAVNRTVAGIRLYKQNDAETRIGKENITIYTSPDNSFYKPYDGDYTVEEGFETAAETIRVSRRIPDYAEETLTEKGARIRVLTIGGLAITDRFIAVGVKCAGECPDGVRFVNTPCAGIAIFDEDGKKICATPGGTCRSLPLGAPYLDAGFNFDDGFGAYTELTLDPDDGEGYFAVAKGKNEYVHGALCECEPEVQEYWMSLLDQALADGYDLAGNRIECHSVHVDEPFAYGYNDCVKEAYFRQYGVCDEKDMDLGRIGNIRGNAYSKLFSRGAARIHDAGKKVAATLNIEMLHDPIPLDRRYAYPMNVRWQWERWLEETHPDEINFRMYFNTPRFLLNDPQCRRMLETAKSYGVPMTVERYVYFDIEEEYRLLNDTGLFSGLIVYETANLFSGTKDRTVVPTDRGRSVLSNLKKLAGV